MAGTDVDPPYYVALSTGFSYRYYKTRSEPGRLDNVCLPGCGPGSAPLLVYGMSIEKNL